jgi:hypothetical protein
MRAAFSSTSDTRPQKSDPSAQAWHLELALELIAATMQDRAWAAQRDYVKMPAGIG